MPADYEICPICGCVTAVPVAHADWHDRNDELGTEVDETTQNVYTLGQEVEKVKEDIEKIKGPKNGLQGDSKG